MCISLIRHLMHDRTMENYLRMIITGIDPTNRNNELFTFQQVFELKLKTSAGIFHKIKKYFQNEISSLSNSTCSILILISNSDSIGWYLWKRNMNRSYCQLNNTSLCVRVDYSFNLLACCVRVCVSEWVMKENRKERGSKNDVRWMKLINSCCLDTHKLVMNMNGHSSIILLITHFAAISIHMVIVCVWESRLRVLLLFNWDFLEFLSLALTIFARWTLTNVST